MPPCIAPRMLGEPGSSSSTTSSTAGIATRMELETSLRHAVVRKELRAFYQPIVAADSGVIVRSGADLSVSETFRG